MDKVATITIFLVLGILLGVALMGLYQHANTSTTATITQREEILKNKTITITKTYTYTYTTTYTKTFTMTIKPHWCNQTLHEETLTLKRGEIQGTSFFNSNGAPSPGEVILQFQADGRVLVTLGQYPLSPIFKHGKKVNATSGIVWIPIAKGYPVLLNIQNLDNSATQNTIYYKLTYYYVCPPPQGLPPRSP